MLAFKKGLRAGQGRLILGAALGLAVASTMVQAAEDEHMHHHHHHHQMDMDTIQKSEVRYTMPDVKVTTAEGVQRDFAKDMESGGPVIVNFIYTSCTAICPMSTQIFASLQQKLGKDAAKVRLVSVSIDPEYDTPERLAAYAKKFGAGPNWTFYTSSQKGSVAIQKAFNAYHGDKMNHTAVTFMRQAPGQPWLRIDGMAGSDELLAAFRGMKRPAK